MAREKKVEEVIVESETPAVEETQEELPLIRTITLKGSVGSQFHGSVNGVNFAYPCGVELEVPEHIYHAVKAHLA